MRSLGLRRFLAFALLAPLVAAVPFSAGPAYAQSGSIFTVSGVRVDATGESAQAARTVALSQGQAEAATRLLQRLTVPEDWSLLPPVEADQAATWTAGIGVSNEKASTTRYLATLSVRFNPAAIRNVLREAGVRFTESQAAPVLLLPVLDTPGVRVLFDDPNPWRAAWDRLNLANSLVPIRLPLGDLEDFAAITPADALTADWTLLQPIAARYGVDQVLVAHATGGEGGGLTVSLTRVGAGVEENIVRTFPGEPLDTVAGEAARALHQDLVAAWKRQTAVSFGAEQQLAASVEFASLSEWLSIRQRLADTSLVQKVDVVAVSNRGAQIDLHFAGDISALTSSLAQRQVRLVEDIGYWTMTLGGAQPAGPEGAGPVYEPGDEGIAAPGPETQPQPL